MSKSDTCLRCGKPGHTSSSCKQPLPDRIAPHTVEPHDGHDGMVRCVDCARAGVPDFYGRGGCPAYVPSLALQRIHCARFSKGGRR